MNKLFKKVSWESGEKRTWKGQGNWKSSYAGQSDDISRMFPFCCSRIFFSWTAEIIPNVGVA